MTRGRCSAILVSRRLRPRPRLGGGETCMELRLCNTRCGHALGSGGEGAHVQQETGLGDTKYEEG